MIYREEIMSDEFTKWVLELEPDFHPNLHKFTGADKNGPHNHPNSFQTYILKGGYVERIYTIHDFELWSYVDVYRLPGTSHRVEATCIHEIIKLLDGPCYTVMTPEPEKRNWGWWKFNNDGYWYQDNGTENWIRQ